MAPADVLGDDSTRPAVSATVTSLGLRLGTDEATRLTIDCTASSDRSVDVLSSTEARVACLLSVKSVSWGTARWTEAFSTPSRAISVRASSPSTARW